MATKFKSNELTPEQRRCELIRILSGGIARMIPQANIPSKTLKNNEKKGLALPPKTRLSVPAVNREPNRERR